MTDWEKMSPEEKRRVKVVDRVIYLAELSDPNHGATPAERETAERMGKALIARHGLSLAEVEARAQERGLAEEPPRRRPPPPAPPRWPTVTVTFGGHQGTGTMNQGIWFEFR